MSTSAFSQIFFVTTMRTCFQSNVRPVSAIKMLTLAGPLAARSSLVADRADSNQLLSGKQHIPGRSRRLQAKDRYGDRDQPQIGLSQQAKYARDTKGYDG